MTHEDTFFDSSLREAISGETPPDVLARVLARAPSTGSGQARERGLQPRELESSTAGRSTTGRPTTRRWIIARVMGALCLSILAGGAVAFASSLLAPAPVSGAKQPSLEELSVKVVAVNAAVSQLENSSKLRALKIEAAEAEAARLLERLATPEEKVERALVENERKRRERFEQAEIQRRERHLAWVQEVRKAESKRALDEMTAQIGLSAEQQQQAGKVLDDWGTSVYSTFKGHYRGHHEPRETMDNVASVNQKTCDALRDLLDSRQQLQFDKWLGKYSGALAKGTDRWVPAAVDLDDENNFDEWRR